MYTAVVLDQVSHQKLIEALKDRLEGYDDIIAHHMTINMGSCEMPTELGKPYQLKVIGIGFDALVVAVKVETECMSDNATKHITVAVNRALGGKPFYSNRLTNWEPFEGPILNGIVKECS